MKITELKNLTIKEIQKILDEKRIELSKSRIDVKMGRSSSVHTVKSLKEDIARILTELNIRRLA